jgi:ABC-type antimicrobial peptide transport system permease subunit
MAGRGFTAADSGRGLVGDASSPSFAGSVVLNEAAVRRLRLSAPLNQTIVMNGGQWTLRVVGVVKDALMLSPFSPAEPTFFIDRPQYTSTLIYRLSPKADIHDAVSKLTAIFNRYNPAYPYSWHFADESYATKFSLETLIGRLAAIFAALAIFISCLGLFGLATVMADQRRKEIGIRKVLGASVPQVWALLSKDFVWMTTLSVLVATPVAYYFLDRWLQQYDYRIVIRPWVFVAAGGAAILVTTLTVSFRSVKAALANPAESIRTE